MTIKEGLKKARKLIDKGWTKGAFARTKSGKECFSQSPNAVKFCLLGAVSSVFLDSSGYDHAKKALARTLPNSELGIAQFNDNCKNKQQVLDLIDRAISRC